MIGAGLSDSRWDRPSDMRQSRIQAWGDCRDSRSVTMGFELPRSIQTNGDLDKRIQILQVCRWQDTRDVDDLMQKSYASLLTIYVNHLWISSVYARSGAIQA